MALAPAVRAQAVADFASAPALAAAMRSAATALLAETPASERGRLAFAFDDALRADLHYTPRSRAGIAFKDTAPTQRATARALFEALLSVQGLAQVNNVMALELVLRELESGSSLRVPQNYAIALYSPPTASEAWGWPIEGHHLSLRFTVQGDVVVSTLPQFVGANPALTANAVAGQKLAAGHWMPPKTRPGPCCKA